MLGYCREVYHRQVPFDFLLAADDAAIYCVEMTEKAFRAAGTDFKTVQKGAATSVLLAASPLLEGVGGRYFEDCNEAVPVNRRGGPGRGGVAPYALDPANAERLWELSLNWTQ